jgi:hypothetical protein
MRDWLAKQPAEKKPTFIRQVAAAIETAGGKVKVYTPVTELEVKAIAAISADRVTYLPATGPKRFARQIQGATQLTDAQRGYVWAIAWKFRRQIKDAALVAEAKRIGGVA